MDPPADPRAIESVEEWLAQFAQDVEGWAAIFKTLDKDLQKKPNVLPGALKMKKGLTTLQKLDPADAGTLPAIQPIFREVAGGSYFASTAGRHSQLHADRCSPLPRWSWASSM